MALDHSRLGLENKFLENKSGRIFCFRQVYFTKSCQQIWGSVNQPFILFIDHICKLAGKWHSKQSKKSAANMNFIIRHSCFPQSYYFGFKVIIPDPKLLIRIPSYFSGSKVITPDPKLLFRIQSYYSGSRYYYESKVITPDWKLLLRIQSYILRIQSCYSGSKVMTPDPKLLLQIQSYYSGFKVITPDPKL